MMTKTNVGEVNPLVSVSDNSVGWEKAPGYFAVTHTIKASVQFHS